MKTHDDIITETTMRSVMLGTNRTPLEGVVSDEPERDLLLAVAERGLQRRAGYVPGHDHRPLDEPCPPDDTPMLSEKAMSHFSLMVKHQYSDHVEDWLWWVLMSGKRPPDEFLPSLLELGRKKMKLREAVHAIVAVRGRWLADQIRNRDWKWVRKLDEEKGIADIQTERDFAIERERARGEAFERVLLGQLVKPCKPFELPDSLASIPGLIVSRHLWSDGLTAWVLSRVREYISALPKRGVRAYRQDMWSVLQDGSFSKCFYQMPMAKVLHLVQSDYRRAVLKQGLGYSYFAMWYSQLAEDLHFRDRMRRAIFDE